jgi:hypothetical protein
MEKTGAITPGITPDTEAKLPTIKSADCASGHIVDNEKRKIQALDDDFRKQAANQAAGRLNQ